MSYNKYDDYERNDYEKDDYEKDEKSKDIGRFNEVDKVCIGCPKPCITTLLEGSVKVEIRDTKVIKNCDGFKLVVEGCKYIKIQYCSNDKCGCNKIFTDTFVVPFTHAINYCGCYRKLCDVDAYVYECSMKKISNRCVLVKSKICVDPDFEDYEYEDWDDNWDCNCKIDSNCKKASNCCGK